MFESENRKLKVFLLKRERTRFIFSLSLSIITLIVLFCSYSLIRPMYIIDANLLNSKQAKSEYFQSYISCWIKHGFHIFKFEQNMHANSIKDL